MEGNYKVVISKYAAPASSDDSGEDEKDHDADDGNDGHAAAGDGADEGKTLVPPQYSSSESTPLRAEVKAGGENVFSFEIE